MPRCYGVVRLFPVARCVAVVTGELRLRLDVYGCVAGRYVRVLGGPLFGVTALPVTLVVTFVPVTRCDRLATHFTPFYVYNTTLHTVLPTLFGDSARLIVDYGPLQRLRCTIADVDLIYSVAHTLILHFVGRVTVTI